MNRKFTDVKPNRLLTRQHGIRPEMAQRSLHRPAVAGIIPDRASDTDSHPPPSRARNHSFPKNPPFRKSPAYQAPEPFGGQKPRRALRALRGTPRVHRDGRGGTAVPVFNQISGQRNRAALLRLPLLRPDHWKVVEQGSDWGKRRLSSLCFC